LFIEPLAIHFQVFWAIQIQVFQSVDSGILESNEELKTCLCLSVGLGEDQSAKLARLFDEIEGHFKNDLFVLWKRAHD